MRVLPEKYTAPCLALLRIVAGLMFACHGSQKLLGWPHSPMGTVPLMSKMGLAGGLELVGGLMIAIGLLTPIVAFILSGEMAVAYFTAHFSVAQWNPVANKGELAVLYCFLFLFYAAHGAGIWSADGQMGRGGSTRRA